jgi:SAM-dependent MidA family methyltransferase
MQALLSKEINATNADQPWLRFDRYMELCLYAEEIGYYTRPTTKVGPEGDFYTSSNVGSIMGEMIAAWIHAYAEEHLEANQPIQVVEWGGGTGRLAKQILDAWQSEFPYTYARASYCFSEISPYHLQLQQEATSAHANKIVAPSKKADEQAHVFVLANELLDAMPCRRLRKIENRIQELGVVESDGQLQGEWRDAEALDVPRAFLEQIHDNQQFEWVEGVSGWFEAVDATYTNCTLIAIDYGDVEAELASSHRMEGTFVCYRKHQATDDAFAFPGEQDMTAHVNFTQVARIGEKLGWRMEPLRTQKQFLIEAGILEKLQAHGAIDPFDPRAKRNRAIRQLLLTDQMSELFKVCIAHK